jgi:hypothetical protein
MNWLQIRLFGPYFSSFSTNSYGYYSQKSQNLFSNTQIFASALIVRQAARPKSQGLMGSVESWVILWLCGRMCGVKVDN